ncbi:MAG: DEAD/DEAH box helicase [Bacteroidales bacterium]|nr:DEAD/DEAH box helicase [Bacteroidales bacterium]
MNVKFSLLIQEHKKFGQLFQPFLIEDDGKEYYSIVDRLADDKIEYYKKDLTESEIKIVKAASQYTEKNIAAKFSYNKQNSRDFLTKLKDDYTEKFIRPFIEKQIAKCISLARKNNTPIFYRETKNVVYQSDFVAIEEEPAEIVFNFTKLPDETHYFQTISHKGKSIYLKDRQGFILTNDPCWMMLDQKLYHFKQDVDGKKLKLFFDKEFITVPEKHEKKYYSTFIKNCIRDFPIKLEGIELRQDILPRHPVLKLELDFSGLPGLFLYFNYGEETTRNVDAKIKLVKYIHHADKPVFEIISRDKEWESSIIDSLTKHKLKRSFENVFIVEDKTQKYDLVNWINENSALLHAHHFQIEQELAGANYYTGPMRISVSFEEKNDWFDVYAVAKFGDDFEIPVIQLRKHLLNNIREYKLPDGRIAILPEDWFNKYADLVTFGTRNRDRIRISKPHFGLIQNSLNQSMHIERSDLNELAKKVLTEPEALPEGINATLRVYQNEGYQWLNFLRNHKFGGCLADDMGLGKTLQTLSLLVKHINETKPADEPAPTLPSAHIDLFSELEKLETGAQPSLVVMPSSLIHNWSNEIQKFTPHIKYLNYTGPQRHELLPKISQSHLILTTYGTIRNDFEELKKIPFDYIILDESQIIKNPTSKTARAIFKLEAKYRLALSGTPIENSLMDLWSQMNFLNPGLLGDLKFFKDYFANPIEKNNDEEKQKKLHLLIKPFILRRTKTQVEKELPQLSEEYVYCEMSPEQQLIYHAEKIAIRNIILQSLEHDGLSNTAFAMVQALTKLRQLANHPIMLTEHYKYGSGKFDEVIRNLETLISEGHKVLVFSSFVKHLNIFTQYFDNNNLKYALLTGQSRKREEIINEFQTDPQRNVFFISLKAGGVGLNLTEAEYVFILDPWWNPQAENQAVNRAHRIGQTKPVIAYRFISLDTIEEKILKLQRKKSKLAEMFIRNENPLKELNADSIKELIA